MAGEIGINISTSEVRTGADAIEIINKNLTTNLDEINIEMKNLESVWDSDASRSIKSKFTTFQKSFEEYKQVVESYVRFLRDSAGAYEGVETNLQNYADSFKA